MPIDEQTLHWLRRHAKELADAAPELTAEQTSLLISVFARYPMACGGDDA